MGARALRNPVVREGVCVVVVVVVGLYVSLYAVAGGTYTRVRRGHHAKYQGPPESDAKARALAVEIELENTTPRL